MKTAEWTLRLARTEDAEFIPAVEAAAAMKFAGFESLGIHASETLPVERLLRYIRKGHCLVAHVAGELVGFLVSEPFGPELHVWETDVHPAYQGRGIGSGLVRACLIDARIAGYRAVTLTTFRDIPWNGPFYTRLGFTEVVALDAHPRLASELALEVDNGLPAESRCAMIHFLD